MTEYRFYHPIEVRYGDLDPQGHLNNAKYLTYMEQARIAYLRQLGLWKGGSFLEIGVIMADANLQFNEPILWGETVHVGLKITRLGNKSLSVEQTFWDPGHQTEYATGSTVLVTYDYHSEETIRIPDDWRKIIQDFEGLDGIE